MLQESEIVLALLALGVLTFHLFNVRRLRETTGGLLLLSAYSFMVAAWILTNLEELAQPVLFNLLEHVGYTLGMVLVFVWCRNISAKGERHE